MNNITSKQFAFIDFINNCKKNNKFVHSYLIECDDNELDFNFILNFIKLLLCEKKNIKYEELDCGKCNICNMISGLTYPDLYIIDVPNDSNVIKKEQILKLEDEFKNTSILDNLKIYIIKNSDKMNLYASNTLLKFLEEPNDNIIGILLTNNKFKLLPTIVSRCQCLSLRDYYIISNDDNNIYELISFIFNKNSLFLNYDDIVNNMFSDNTEKGKLDKNKTISIITNVCFILENYLYAGDNNLDYLKDYSNDKIYYVINCCYDSLLDLSYNVNLKLWLDSLFSKIIGGLYD